jgi:hypothetical protein
MNQIAVIAQQYMDNEHMARNGGRLWLTGNFVRWSTTRVKDCAEHWWQ